ncbi:hypothetical protein BVC80_8819g19 [Macleaya cordata]|uniref:Uncharacterized protein n=1 Tax=Macleaya cordata TaxID=56857 RepID=A0A200PSH0_MACCD|nr:hypothetical protein BVC80_8819g19 [Macleaya cordata]
MSEVDVNGRRKRQLPSWMLGISNADQLQKSKNEAAKISSSELQPVSRVLKPKRIPLAERLEKEVESRENDGLEVGSSLLVKCETRKRKKKSRQQDLDDDDPFDSDGGLRKKRTKKRSDGVGSKIQQSTTRKNRSRKTNEAGGREEFKAASPSEEDEELTMEDLMSIAEEYVKADQGQACQQPATTEPESTQFPASSDFSRNESGGYIEATQSSIGLPTSTTTWLSSDFTKTRLNNQDSSASMTIIGSPCRTGDPTQDMLDLFLGPLLRKPQTEERKFESVTEDITLDCEFRKQNQSENLGKEVVPLMKKKSSLKDKVAMFFD